MGRGTVTEAARFDTVFGSRRGSADAQARRDIDERAQTMQRFAEQIHAALRTNNPLRTDDTHLLDRLAAAWKKTAKDGCGGAVRETLVRELVEACNDGGVRELAAIADLGDPLFWPGLTAPAVEALGRHFTVRAGAAVVSSHAFADLDIVLNSCLTFHLRDRARLERLRPLCEGIGLLLARYLPPTDRDGGVGYKAALVLQDVLEESLTGPLASWVSAYEQRAKAKTLSDAEAGALIVMLTVQTRDTGAVWPALKPLAKRLSYRPRVGRSS